MSGDQLGRGADIGRLDNMEQNDSLIAQRRREAAQRALAEAAERRLKAQAETGSKPVELGGRKGPEPTRFGDWELNGIATDF